MTQADKRADHREEEGYLRRFNRVIDYIYAHLDDDPDLAVLADVAALSPWHWHRVWRAAYGETVVATVKRLRLHRASADLTYSRMSIAEISTRAGYSSQEAFSRSFKAVYGLAPSAYRKSGVEGRLQPVSGRAPHIKTRGSLLMHSVDIKLLPSETLAVIPHTGPYMEIGKAFETAIGVLVSRNLMGRAGAMKALYYSDPTHVPEAELQSAAGVSIPEGFPVEPPFEAVETFGGDYAVLHYKGPYADMKWAYEWLYGDWLPRSGREPADAPCLEVYLNNPRDTAPADLLTDICLPLKPAA